VDAFDLHVLEIGPVRALVAPTVREVDELQPHRVIEICLELDAAHFDHSGPPIALCFVCQYVWSNAGSRYTPTYRNVMQPKQASSSVNVLSKAVQVLKACHRLGGA